MQPQRDHQNPDRPPRDQGRRAWRRPQPHASPQAEPTTHPPNPPPHPRPRAGSHFAASAQGPRYGSRSARGLITRRARTASPTDKRRGRTRPPPEARGGKRPRGSNCRPRAPCAGAPGAGANKLPHRGASAHHGPGAGARGWGWGSPPSPTEGGRTMEGGPNACRPPKSRLKTAGVPTGGCMLSNQCMGPQDMSRDRQIARPRRIQGS